MGRIISSVTVLLLGFVTSKAFDIKITPDYNVPAQIGDKLELTCSTTGCESPSFSWRTQMDNPLGGSVTNVGSSSILTMDPVGIENEHEYLCSACCGSQKEERSIRVDVYSFPSDPVIEISTPLNVGEKANITCMVPKVYPSERLTMQLKKDGSVLSMKEFFGEGSTVTTETKSLPLTFIPTFEDIGKAITCVAELPIDEMEFEPKKRQTSQRLSVNFPPQNTTELISPSDNVDEGENITIMSTTYSNSPPQTVPQKIHPSNTTILSSQNDTSTVSKNDTGIHHETGNNNETRNNTDGIEITVVEMVKETDFVIPVIVVLSCLSTVATPALAILVYRSRKAKINGSYSPVNAPKPNV
ncbi:vascular cell adhesion protein 1-like isoform X3 [Trachemys scripta elegans]|uniref:vascular cell adhesion protein 1-like isoform X3 n=1 Tax=Trachemys scripta elegans TaxID=31138 RepID=UPI001552948A|nr:vascular cell adhesion protein 1-like isoform X3 [Trachemys scripta elegans]